MDYFTFLLYFCVFGMVHCQTAKEKNNAYKTQDNIESKTYNLLKTVLRRIETLEVKQRENTANLEKKCERKIQENTVDLEGRFEVKLLEKNKEIEKRVTALEKQFVVEQNKNRPNVKQDVKLNDTSDLEGRVSNLELGLAALADNLDELQESQVWQDILFIYPLIRIRIRLLLRIKNSCDIKIF